MHKLAPNTAKPPKEKKIVCSNKAIKNAGNTVQPRNNPAMPLRIKCTLPRPSGMWMVPATKKAAANNALSGIVRSSNRLIPNATAAVATALQPIKAGRCKIPSDKCIFNPY